MSTATLTPEMTDLTVTGAAARATQRRAAIKRPSFARLVGVEARKTFDTRAGWWLCASILVLAIIASVAVIVFSPTEAQTYQEFSSAIGIPMALILPVLAILSITSEWSQRSGLTTFTMVPHRGRVIAAKAAVSAIIGVVSMLIAMAVGAAGTIVGSAIAGIDPVWNATAPQLASIVVANLLGMAVGFMLGLLFRNSPAAVVGYFVYSFVLTPISYSLANVQQWWADAQPWADFNYATTVLFEDAPTAKQWLQLGTASLPWLIIPLLIALWTLRRSEVK